jgi:hypothetical protein
MLGVEFLNDSANQHNALLQKSSRNCCGMCGEDPDLLSATQRNPEIRARPFITHSLTHSLAWLIDIDIDIDIDMIGRKDAFH